MQLSRLSAFLLPLMLATTGQAKEGEKTVTSTVTAAKVFLRGAQVSRTAKATVPAGSSTLVFTGLAQGLDAQSIQVSGKGAFSILSVAHRINYLTESPKKAELEALEAKVKAKEHTLNAESNTKAVWDQEEQLLLKNSAIGGQQNGVSAEQLKAVNAYVRQRLAAVKAGQLAQQEKIAVLNKALGKLRQQVNELKGQQARPTSEVVLELTAKAAVPGRFTLSYFVPDASWTPAYDLRATGTGKPLALTMKARVLNNTGEDWKRVDLALSSGNPTLGGVMPTLRPWTLAVYRAFQALPHRGRASRAPAAPSEPMRIQAEADMREETTAGSLVANTVNQRTTTMEFSIDAPFSVPADGVAHSVQVQQLSVPATYAYYCTPKLDPDAFLYARTTGWENLNLLPGEANVFFEGTYVGKSQLDPARPQDTLDISLGRDKGISVKRVKRKRSNDKAIIGGKRTVAVGWDITVRNNKHVPVELELRDQYPLSPRSEVEVKLKDHDGAEANEQTGLLTWKLQLAPKETKKIGFGYTVKYPKDLPVVVE